MALDLIKAPGTDEVPFNLDEAGDNALQNIINEVGFGKTLVTATNAGKQVSEVIAIKGNVNARIIAHIQGTHDKVALALNRTPDQAKAAFKADFMRKEQTMLEQYIRLSAKIEQVLENIRAKAGTNTALTANGLLLAAKDDLKTIDIGDPATPYIEAHFADTVSELLKKPYVEADHNALKQQIMNEIRADASFPGDKLLIGDAIEGYMDTLRAWSGHIGKGTDLFSPQAVDGLIGKVLTEPEARDVFAGNLDVIRNLPSGSVKLHFADSAQTFYHTEGADDMPAPIKALFTDAGFPRRLTFLHYRTDEAVRNVIKDMSIDEKLVVQRKDMPGSITIEGLEGDDCVITVVPPNLTKAEVLATPMKYLDHEFDLPEQVVTP